MKCNYIILLVLMGILQVSCASYRQSLYLQNDDILNQVSQDGLLYEYHIMPKDELTIVVSTSDPEASAPFYRKILHVLSTKIKKQ